MPVLSKPTSEMEYSAEITAAAQASISTAIDAITLDAAEAIDSDAAAAVATDAEATDPEASDRKGRARAGRGRRPSASGAAPKRARKAVASDAAEASESAAATPQCATDFARAALVEIMQFMSTKLADIDRYCRGQTPSSAGGSPAAAAAALTPEPEAPKARRPAKAKRPAAAAAAPEPADRADREEDELEEEAAANAEDVEAAALANAHGESPSDAPRKPGGFSNPVPISEVLARFLVCEAGLAQPGLPSADATDFSGAVISRTDVTKAVCSYVKERGLKDPEDGRIIRPDATLAAMLTAMGEVVDAQGKPADVASLTFFTLQKWLSKHFPAAGRKRARKAKDAAPSAAAEEEPAAEEIPAEDI